MTEQHAKPTPGPPWPQLTAMGDRIYGETPEDGIMACAYGDPELAELFAAAPATAAERDRLLKERETTNAVVEMGIVKIDELRDERDRLRLEIEQCHAKSTCCCGDYMKQHSTHSGHNPVSMYDHALFNVEAERDRLVKVNEGLVGALDQLIEEKADYMRLNNLGDPEKQHTIKVGRAELAKAAP